MPPPLPFPEFRPRAPWIGPDLQTVRNLLRGPVALPDASRSERLRLPMEDGTGDVLCARLEWPKASAPPASLEGAMAAASGRPVVVLVHGLSGCEDSAYMQASAAFWLDAGHPVVRLNLRGAGPSRAQCRQQYHAGRSEDLRAVLRGLPSGLDRDGLLLVGYSLGGNVLLKFLAESGRSFPLVAAASVSAPIDLSESSRSMLLTRNRVYQKWLLSSMRREAQGPGCDLGQEEAQAIHAAESIWEFDDRFVAPRNGYRDAAHYYAENHARRFLPEIRVPTLMIHALDDPWIPGRLYTELDWSANPSLHPLLPRGGGHVGFHARDHRSTWHDRCIARFLASFAAFRPVATLEAS